LPGNPSTHTHIPTVYIFRIYRIFRIYCICKRLTLIDMCPHLLPSCVCFIRLVGLNALCWLNEFREHPAGQPLQFSLAFSTQPHTHTHTGAVDIFRLASDFSPSPRHLCWKLIALRKWRFEINDSQGKKLDLWFERIFSI